MNQSIVDNTQWTYKKIKMAICVPTRDMVHSHFAFCLAQLFKTTSDIGIETYLFFDSGTVLLNQREHLVKMAKDVDADYILWLDSDMIFPSTTAVRLLNHNRDIVACNYMKRTQPQNTVAYVDTNDWESWVPLIRQDGLIKVQGVGMGCMLMKTECFDKLRKPYFEFTYTEKTQDWIGEDFTLQQKLQNNGYEIFIDTVLSMELKHMGIQAFGSND